MDRIITQIGSLPHVDVDSAVQYSLGHDIPFLPELVARKETMLNYIRDPGKLACLDLFRNSVKGRKSAKVQCVGPATLIVNGGYSADDAVARVRAHIEAIVSVIDGYAEDIEFYQDF